MPKKKWVNVYVHLYDKDAYYVSTSYLTKEKAILALNHYKTKYMGDRYIKTVKI